MDNAHPLLQLLEPVEDDVDLRRRCYLKSFKHQKPSVRVNIVGVAGNVDVVSRKDLSGRPDFKLRAIVTHC